MPFTPLHIPVAYATWLIMKKRIPLAPLVLANMAPDIEVPLIYLLYRIGIIRIDEIVVDRLVLHSILGGLILVPMLLLLIYPLYSKIILAIIKLHCPKVNRRNILIAGSIGGLSHVLVDATHHSYNPLLYPFTIQSINSLIIGDYRETGIIVHVFFSILLLILIIYGYGKYKKVRDALAFILGCTGRKNR